METVGDLERALSDARRRDGQFVFDTVQRHYNPVVQGLATMPKPVIAAVNGWALAGGFETALACDIRIASERAMFGSFEVRRGFHHGDGGIARLVNTCGSGIALEGRGTHALKGVGGPFPTKQADLFLGNAGTAFRPLTAALAILGGTYELTCLLHPSMNMTVIVEG